MSQPAPDPLFLEFQLALAGRYSIDRELGRGGMGVVFLAREVHLDRLVAIKVLPPEKSQQPALRERFLQEAGSPRNFRIRTSSRSTPSARPASSSTT